MRLLAPAVAAVALVAVGCKPKLEDQIPGTWAGPNNSTVTFAKEKTWTSDVNAGITTLKVAGDWSVSGDTVTMTAKTVNGQPVAKFAEQVLALAKRMNLPANQVNSVKDMGKASQFKASSDGKTLTEQNPTSGQAQTLTKK